MSINKAMAEQQELSKETIKDIEALHYAMAAMVTLYNNRYTNICPMSKKGAKELRRQVRRLEYQLQDLWGFPIDKKKHYHWRRFYDLQCLSMHRQHTRSRKMSTS